MARFQVRQRTKTARAAPQFLVVDTEDKDRPVAEFDDRQAADAHATRLNEGPLDWDEQEAWEEDDDWGADPA